MPTLKNKICIVYVLILLLTLTSCLSPPVHSPGDDTPTADQAINYLNEGNARFVSGKEVNHKTKTADRNILAGGQKPFAVILTCADSRVSPEIVFDQKLGDIFVIRVAGNVTDEAVLGSVEYAAEHLNVPLIVVLGHTECGAVAGALSDENEFPENLQYLINIIRGNIKSSNPLTAVHENAHAAAEKIANNEVVKECDATVVSAVYDIHTGVVTAIP